MKANLSMENKIVDIPDLNRFRIGDHVIADACFDHDRFEGVIIGIELVRVHGFRSLTLTPSITLLHDGDQITDEFQPAHLRKVEGPPPAEKMVATGEPVSPPEFALQMNEYAAFVAKKAPRLHWKVWHANKDDRSLYEGGFDGWRHGFGMVQLEPAPLPDLMREMRSALLTKLEDQP